MAHLAKWQGIVALTVQVVSINVLLCFGVLGTFFHRTLHGTDNEDVVTMIYLLQQMMGALFISYSCGSGLLLLPQVFDYCALYTVRNNSKRSMSLQCLRLSAVLTALLAFSMIVLVLLKSLDANGNSSDSRNTTTSVDLSEDPNEVMDLSKIYLVFLSIGMTVLFLSSVSLMVTFWPVPYRSAHSHADSNVLQTRAVSSAIPESASFIPAAAALLSFARLEEQDTLLDPLLTGNDDDYQLMEDGARTEELSKNAADCRPEANNEVDVDGTIPVSPVTPIESDPVMPTQSGTRRLLKLAAPEALYLYIGSVVLLCRLPFSLAIPHFVSTTLAALVNSDFPGARSEIRLLVVAGTIDAVLDFWAFFLFGYANQRIVRSLRVDLFRRLMGQEVAFFDIHSSGELASRLNSDCSEMASDLTWFFRFSIESLVRVSGISGYMLIRCPMLGACALSVIPAVACVNKLYGQWLRENAIKVQDALADANEIAQEALSNVRTVIAFVAESQECHRYEQRIEHQYQLNIRQLFMTALYFMGVSTFLINTAVQGLLLWVGSILVERNKLSAGVLFAFMLYQYQLQGEVMSLLNSFTSIIKSSGAGEKVFSLIDRDPPPPSTGNRMTEYESSVTPSSERPYFDDEANHNADMVQSSDECVSESGNPEHGYIGHTTMERHGPSMVQPKRDRRQYHVRFENVSFSYPSRSQNMVLDGLNLEIPEGKTVALVGASGCGKTTIVNLLQRFYDPSGGRILVNGMDLRSLDVQMHRRHIGAVTQEPVLFRGSLRDNITYGCAVADEVRSEHVTRAAQLAHADGFIQTFPDQYETAVGERGVQLSGGQKQRIAIARALIVQPSLLLLDEATSSLDTESEIAVQQALDELLLHSNNRITTVVIAHRLRTVQNAHKIVVLQNGRVAEEGSHQELLLQPTGVYRRMVERAASTGVLLDS